jgi:hypothetical protein
MTDYDMGKDALFARLRENDAARIKECQYLIDQLNEVRDRSMDLPTGPEETIRKNAYLSGLTAAINLIHSRMEELGSTL